MRARSLNNPRHMQRILLFVLGMLLLSCAESQDTVSVDPVNWEKRKVQYTISDSLSAGSTYLSVYSQIYSRTEQITNDLTVTVSMRNTDAKDSLYLDKATYYDTHGTAIRHYFNHPIYIAPMETVEIIIKEVDKEGGTGANFLFDWRQHPGGPEPLFEAVMISTSGQQGLSFSTTGKRIR